MISKGTRREIFNEQCEKCADCNKDSGDQYELDHIQPLSGGGTNDRDNLEFLCKACHVEKSKEEHAEYIKRDEISSSLNLQAAETLDSKFSKKVAFSHSLAEYFNEDELQSIDIIKDRRNSAMYSGYNFCKYSVLDNWEPFDGEVEDGHYYIETDNYELFHKNGIYSRPIVDHGLAEGIITLKNIEQQFKPSSVISSDYFQNFIHYLDEMFKESGEEKLAVNSWIGLLGRRHCSYIQQAYTLKDDIATKAEIYEKFYNPCINQLDDNVLSITNKKTMKKLETNFYIHSQILDIEAVELHKLVMKIKEVGGVPICVKTDCVIFTADKSKPLDISNEFWAPGIPKYRYEKEPMLVKNEVKIFNEDKLTFEETIYKNYTEDVTIEEIIEKDV